MLGLLYVRICTPCLPVTCRRPVVPLPVCYDLLLTLKSASLGIVGQLTEDMSVLVRYYGFFKPFGSMAAALGWYISNPAVHSVSDTMLFIL